MTTKIYMLIAAMVLVGAGAGSVGTLAIQRHYEVVAAAPAAAITTVHTVSWYRANPAVLRARVAWCNDHVGFAVTDADCQNAAAAL